MTKYKLIIENPEGDIGARLKNNPQFKPSGKNQWTLWDGPANLKDIKNLFDLLAPICCNLSLYCDKRGSITDLKTWK
jgi:hypothetical protein